MLRVTPPVAEVVEQPRASRLLPHHRDLVHERTHTQPGAILDAVIADDVLAQPEAEHVHQEIPRGRDVGGQHIDVVERRAGTPTRGRFCGRLRTGDCSSGGAW